jgi:hypothetical protein
MIPSFDAPNTADIKALLTQPEFDTFKVEIKRAKTTKLERITQVLSLGRGAGQIDVLGVTYDACIAIVSHTITSCCCINSGINACLT